MPKCKCGAEMVIRETKEGDCSPKGFGLHSFTRNGRVTTGYDCPNMNGWEKPEDHEMAIVTKPIAI